MKMSYQDRIDKVRQKIKEADHILIGGGAGLSTSGGLLYGGERFTSNFPDFIKKYKLTDMYSSAFYPFQTEEEKWAYWSRHIKLNRFDTVAFQVYKDLLKIVQDKDYFVITTNGDCQFYKAGFTSERIFSVQGDYAKFQCARACHQKLYDNKDMVLAMVEQQDDCRIPSALVPKCPVCGGRMEPNLRIDQYFVEDEAWHAGSDKYREYLNNVGNKSVVLFELGVGYNTPMIIKTPFEEITTLKQNASLVRINKDYPQASLENKAKTIGFAEDASKVIAALSGI